MTKTRTLDFTDAELPKFRNGREKSLSPKQLRARARRLAAKGKTPGREMALLYKPIEEWDSEELARGRPKAADGTFRGRPPKWVSRELYEQAMDRFRGLLREQLQEEAAGAIQIVHTLLQCEDEDDKGRPLVPPSVKLDAAKWLVEHVLGKPTQRVEQDISVKLQAVLAQAMIVPGSGMLPAALPGEDPLDVFEVIDEDDNSYGEDDDE